VVVLHDASGDLQHVLIRFVPMTVVFSMARVQYDEVAVVLKMFDLVVVVDFAAQGRFWVRLR
jgi:hypothetical protein